MMPWRWNHYSDLPQRYSPEGERDGYELGDVWEHARRLLPAAGEPRDTITFYTVAWHPREVIRLDGGWFHQDYDAAKLVQILGALRFAPIEHDKGRPYRCYLGPRDEPIGFWGAIRPAEIE